ncbi:proprotein convertase P-domain-containing protein [Pseudofulvimonas gallinarii]|uniref:Putative repeat protein (TIGR01451 family) n=2 Tax=Pseudofulvimonas gallinarii TaxID=634155 RepID=A0A4S3KZQ9_9GAMM|nr:proprotein convertase P-domain-containing protein [Pseudofulvimonas gallinarii]TCT00286.1 putative repeat protein (TIGR01451 family) [Pseudofulvimonas gallinarii]THD14128.1 hypothetical protein B1808_04630 [Pseudofulvimonas gallinarii]
MAYSNPPRARWACGLLCGSLTALAAAAAPAAHVHAAGVPTNVTGTEIRTYVGGEGSDPVWPTVFNGDVRQLPTPRAWEPGDSIREIPKGQPGQQTPSKKPLSDAPHVDPLLDLQRNAEPSRNQRVFGTPDLNFAGGGFSGVNPPDTVGVVGPNHYLQAINGSSGTQVRIYDKNTGEQVANFMMQSLGSAQCASGLGDPITLYDQFADRWLISEFSNSGNRMCVYVSQSNDPVSGGWYAYNFQAPSFPDYPKYGVWPTAYFVGTNESTLGLYAFDRVKMLAGQPATFIRLSTTKLSGFGFQMIQPADADGAQQPPTGAPGIFARHRDTEAHGPTGFLSEDFLELFFFQPDFTTPANSTLTGPVQISIAEIDSDLCGLSSFNCFPQPGTSTALDPLREVVMHRLQYRNFGTHEALIGTLVTDVGTNHGGKRWFELRRTGGLAGSWALHQEGTYAPDALNRFMGSISMDRTGNIALGYGTNNGTAPNYPSLRYTGRLAGDPLGTMPQGENTIATGAASNSSNRFGDYSSMNVDPVDDCTFWYTHQYNPTNGQWQTRIASFKFDACLGDGFGVSAAPSNHAICAPDTLDPINVTVTAFNAFSDPVTLALQGEPAGVTGNFTVNPVVPTGNSVANISVGAGTPAGNHTFQIVGTSGALPPSSADINLSVATAAPAATTLTTPADAATGVSAGSTTFAWSAVADAIDYTLEIADSASFSNIVFTTTVATNTATVSAGLDSGTAYYWRVRANNACGSGTNSAVFMFTTSTELCSIVNAAIPDSSPAGLNNALTVSDTGTVDDLRVKLDISHTWVGDVKVTLTKGSTTIDLYNRPGVPASAYGCSGGDITTTLSDAATLSVQTDCQNATPAFPAAEYRPAQPLSAFNGQSLAGTWTLNVSDNAGGDTGTLNSWCLLPGEGSGPAGTADLALVVTDMPDPATIGGDLSLLATVANFGPDTATGVSVEFELPPELTYVSSNIVNSHRDEGDAPRGSAWNCSAAGSTVTCDLSGSLPSVSMAPGLELITAVSGAASAGTISTTATVSGDQIDPDSSNDSVTITTELEGKTDFIFANGFECAAGLPDCATVDPDIVDSGPVNLVVGPGQDMMLNLVTGFFGPYAANSGADFNIYPGTAGVMYFYVFADEVADQSSVADGPSSGQVAVLASGTEIGPSSPLTSSGQANTQNWIGGATGYVGLYFRNESTGQFNYGYVELQTTGPNGFPATITRYVYNSAGNPITIP